MIPDPFDSLTQARSSTRRSAMRALGGLLALVPGAAAANPNQNRGGWAGDGRDGRRRKPHRRRTPHRGGAGSGGAGSSVCPATCPRGSVTVAPTAQGECRCAPVSPGLRDPAFACGGRVNANGDGCCICLFTVEGEGFCAVNTACDTLAGSLTKPCTSSGDCSSGWKCIFGTASFTQPVSAEGFCSPECHTTEGVSPN